MSVTASIPRVTPRVVVPKLWPGETIVVIGGGSSLTREDVDYCRDKARVVAVKEAGCSRIPGHDAPAPWADVLYAADEKYWRFVQGAPEFTGLKYAIEQREGYPPIEWPGVQVLRNLGEHGLEMDPTGLRTGFNSGYQAINLAVHLGAARIVLLGFDCWRFADSHNWFGPHPTHIESPYPVFLQAFNTIVAPLKAVGVTVVNCSRQTMLRAFPQGELREVLA
jgi:hypothetical protein